jgi:hypothetical protein
LHAGCKKTKRGEKMKVNKSMRAFCLLMVMALLGESYMKSGLLKFKKQALALIIIGIFLISPAAADKNGVYLSLTPSSPTENPNSYVYAYFGDEPVIVNITLKNEGQNPVTIMGVPPMTIITNEAMSESRKYLRNQSAKILFPGESCTEEFVWDQKDKNDTKVIPGLYTIHVYYLYSPDDDRGLWDISNLQMSTGSVYIRINPQKSTPSTPLFAIITLAGLSISGVIMICLRKNR